VDSKEWQFEFVLSDRNGRQVNQQICSDLMDVVIEYAERRDLCVGGGFTSINEEGIRANASANE
jgi:hypothetical protein